MRTTGTWALWRRMQYFGIFAVIILIIGGSLYLSFFYSAPSCTDGWQNGDEAGVDCGGVCARICPFQVTQPQVQWARSFEITDGQYNAVAYVENRNQDAATPELSYTFSLYDNQGLITERSGTTILPPDSVYPVFEGRIITNGRTPTRTFLEIEEPENWVAAPDAGPDQFTLVERTLTGADSEPRLDAVLRNNSLEEVAEVEVIATIFDKERNALTSSRTIVENFAPRSETDLVFTWPQAIAGTVRSCEIPTDVLMAIDLSGSMNDDGGTPPQPISTVRDAAERFITRLQSTDQAGVITFATDAMRVAGLSSDLGAVQQAISELSIAAEAETGSTNTGDAFIRAQEEFSSDRHDENARKVLVILTDGRATAPNEDPEAHALREAANLKNTGVEIYAIGLGENVNFEFIQNLASDDTNAYQALATGDINRIYREITSSLCEDGPAIIEVIPKTDAGFAQP